MLFRSIYSWEDGNIKEIMEASIYEIDDLIELLKKYDRLVVNGDGSSLYRERLKEGLAYRIQFSSLGQNSPKASSIAELARIKYSQGLEDDYFSLSPDYLRPSQAERELNK